MLSKAQNKYIRSLTHQKFRKEFAAFVAEGDKIAKEWLASDAKIQYIVALEGWAAQNQSLILKHPEATVLYVNESELTVVSTLQTPNQVLLVVFIPEAPIALPTLEWCIVLDNIQDPGNMGTIIRIADWFGINHIICGEECVDVYNSKVIQAAMGGHIRVHMHKTDITAFLKDCKIPILVAALNGTNIYEMPRQQAAVLVIGNESKGVSASVMQLATQKITIPRRGGAESLNAAISAGIICSLLLPQ